MDQQDSSSRERAMEIQQAEQQLISAFKGSPYALDGLPQFDVVARMKRQDLQNWLRCRLNGIDPFLTTQEDVDAGTTRIDIFRRLIREMPLDWQNLFCSTVADELSYLAPDSHSPYWIAPEAVIRLLELASSFSLLGLRRHCTVQLVQLIESWVSSGQSFDYSRLSSAWQNFDDDSLWRTALDSIVELGIVVHDPPEFWQGQIKAAVTIAQLRQWETQDALNSVGPHILEGWCSVGAGTICDDLISLTTAETPDFHTFFSETLGMVFGEVITRRVSEHPGEAEASKEAATRLLLILLNSEHGRFRGFCDQAASYLPHAWRMRDKIRRFTVLPSGKKEFPSLPAQRAKLHLVDPYLSEPVADYSQSLVEP